MMLRACDSIVCIGGVMFFSYEKGSMDGNEAIGTLFKFLSDQRSNISKIEIYKELVDGLSLIHI